MASVRSWALGCLGAGALFLTHMLHQGAAAGFLLGDHHFDA